MNTKKYTYVILGTLVIAGFYYYNKLVTLDEGVSGNWANVESSYQRRNDLIGNLVETVQGAADFEKSTLESVINARAKATSVNIDASNLTAENIEQFQKAQTAIKGSLDRLLLTVERYPQLQSNQNFLEFQSQIEGTENRIKVDRDRYNKAVVEYNTKVRKFPSNLIANAFSFEKAATFKSDPGSEKAPEVEFDFKN